jgi:ribosome-associated translation inhibitor RaiA
MAPISLGTRAWPAPSGRGGSQMSLVMEGIALDDRLRAVIERKLNAVVGRRRLRPTSVRVAFTDENGPRRGVDIRCVLTMEIPRRPTAHASAVAENHHLAFDGAADAIERELTRERQRRRDKARRPKKYVVAHQGLLPEGEAAMPPARRRRRSA